MAANRETKSAPQSLTGLSKATLADLVWALAATAPDCASCDDPVEVLGVIKDRLGHPWVEAPGADLRTVERLLEREKGSSR